MSYVVDTPDYGRFYCPGCEPERDPFEKQADGFVLLVRYCYKHMALPAVGQVGDEGVPGERVYLSGSGTAGDADNRIVCNGIHRGRWNADPEPGQ